MGKALFVTEKPSVAQDYIKVLKLNGIKRDGYIETEKAYFTWCVGHMVTMSYPEIYNSKYKYWNKEDLPFLPDEFKYEIINNVSKQFNIVKSLLLQDDVDKIYVCTDSGREGEYIYRLVDHMSGNPQKIKKRVWIDSQTEEEVRNGIKNAENLSNYDSLSEAAYLRAKEDYLLGINFSRMLSICYGNTLNNVLGKKAGAIAVGRVMTCVLGMIVKKELEIRNFVKSYFYKIQAECIFNDSIKIVAEWKVSETSKYFNSPKLYSDIGFKTEEDALKFKEELTFNGKECVIQKISKTKEKKNAPLLYNLAELQNECSKKLKISPDVTLSNLQELYEKKLITYPRTDARVLSTSISKEINKNILKLSKVNKDYTKFCDEIIKNELYKKIIKSKYVDDSKITDHYAIIPTGEGISVINSLNKTQASIYDFIVKRFLSIFYPPAEYTKMSIEILIGIEVFHYTNKVLSEIGYMIIWGTQKKEEINSDILLLRKRMQGYVDSINIKRGETSPPKKYTTGSIIIAMENAGKLIEDEELREHISSTGIGTSATRASILKKLEKIEYIESNNKTQILMPTVKGEMIYAIVKDALPSLLNPDLTASWEKGLTLVTKNEIKPEEFMEKLKSYINNNINKIKNKNQASCYRNLLDINKQRE